MTRQLVVFHSAPKALEALERLRKEVRSARSLEQLKVVARTAADIQRRFKPIKEVADKAGRVRNEADLKLESELRRLPKATGTRGQLRGVKPGKRGRRGSIAGGARSEPPAKTAATLADLGVDKKWAARARALAKIPAADRDRIGRVLEREGEANHPANIIKRWKVEEREVKRREYADAVQHGGRVTDLEALAASGQKFSTIYADPPWTFEAYSGKGKERSAERHYDTMSLAAIAALPVAGLAADDCALFLWAVWPELTGALKVVESWGFAYKTVAFAWVKTTKTAEGISLNGDGLHWGMGYWTRANTEVCLLATRGSPTRLAMDVHQVVVAPVGGHSVKPEEVRRRIERLVPGPRLELFGRGKVASWTVWGNQIPLKEAAE
jgi:N6-adenosine-specific RNA methylase IME4